MNVEYAWATFSWATNKKGINWHPWWKRTRDESRAQHRDSAEVDGGMDVWKVDGVTS